MSDLARNIANLSPQQRALLLQRLRDKSTKPVTTRIPRQSRDQRYFLLSFAQQRLWFLEQWQPGSPLYNIPVAVYLRGDLHVEALQQSMQEIVRRHEVLRTTFVQLEHQPVQCIGLAMDIPLNIVDLTSLPAQVRESKALELATEEVRRPFDLARGPLLHMTLLRLEAQHHLLVLTLHHIIADGWSLGVLLRELTTLYAAFSTGTSTTLPALPVQYVDFAVWQRQQLQGALLETHLAYWEKQLTAIPEVLELSADRPRPAVQTFQGARHIFFLSTALSEALRELSQRANVTLFMTLLAAFQLLLHRYTGQEDIVVGTPIANRTQAEIEALIGFFVNTLVLRTDLSHNPPFRTLLDRVREVTLEAYAHQDLPFERLVEALQPERDLSHTPLFQVMFALLNTPAQSWELTGLNINEVPIDTGTSKFDLVLLMEETPGGLKGNLTYSIDLFDEATIQRMVGHYQTLLEGIVSNPEQRLAELPFLTAREQQQIPYEWNDTMTPFPRNACLHQLFEAQAERNPEAIALMHEGRTMRYGELNRQANMLAHRLRHLGVGPEVVVGVCLERGVELVIALLGILKAGGAYLPLDPLYPQERLDFMLQDAQAPLLLTQQSLKERLSVYRTKILCLDENWPEAVLTDNGRTNPTSGVMPENLAYIIYTSGSTGVPKGIAIRHRGVVNNIVDLNRRFSVGVGDSVLALSSLSFDMCVYETLGMLAVGGTTIIPDGGRMQDPAHWTALLHRYPVTLWNSAPALLEMLVETIEAQPERHLPSLRLALLGGDWSPVSLPVRLKAVARNVLFVNLGGATESSIHSTIYPIMQPDPAWKSLPYGRPMANQQTYILDAHLQLVPVGVPGELYLGGVGLARGYLHRPELTAEKFIPHPFSQEPGQRLYRTGDLARFRSDGTIELLGRIDFQVKIRGLRIELDEIASVLRHHPAVQNAVVVVREDKPGSKQLVAYILSKEGIPPGTAELWSFLQQKLPSYMLPAAFVFLETFPLSPNGKVDRRALPPPEQSRLSFADSFVAPRTPVEEVLCGIWANALDREQVGIYDNFFHLGGHSLLATQIIAQIYDTLLTEVPLRTFFTTPTIASLAAYIEAASQQNVNKIAQILLQVERLSDEQVQSMLTQHDS